MAKKSGEGPEYLETLAERLLWAMTYRKTNPNKIEQAIGIPRQTYYAVLRGQTQNFTRPKLVKTCKHLGVSPDWMAEGGAPVFPAPELKDEEEIQLIQDFREMSAQHQKDIADIARRWASEDGNKSDGNPGRSFHHPKPPKQ